MFALDWYRMYNCDRPGVEISIQNKIKKISDGYLVWTKSEYTTAESRSKAGQVVNKTVFADKVAYVFDKNFEKIAIKSQILYDVDGAVVHSYEAPYLDWNLIVPETVGEGLAEWAESILTEKSK